MCGIVGYTGSQPAAPILLEGLSKLEYRGYDSAGLAVRDGDKPAEVVKAVGKLKHLYEKTSDGRDLPGTCGIGHTRWATHGGPSLVNAHPHVSGNCTGSGSGPVESQVVGVHNGIIENFQELKAKLLRHGYQFYSDTDTEVLIKLVDYYYKKYKVGPIDAIAKTLVRVRGSYALAVMFKDYPGQIYAARKDAPMIVGITKDAALLASDVPAILSHTRTVYYVDNLEMVQLKAGEAHFFNLDGDEVKKESKQITWDAKAAEKDGFEHFMIKEIHEQPKVVGDTLRKYIKETEPSQRAKAADAAGAQSAENETTGQSLSQGAGSGKYRIDFSEVGLTDDVLRSFGHIYITACGSAWHVGVETQYVIESMTDISVRVELASEFRYRRMVIPKDSLVIVISQSGETADSLAALRRAKDLGIKTLAIVNVIGSSIAREADYTMYTLAGPEISVATTKAYSCQLVCGYLLAIKFAEVRGTLNAWDTESYRYTFSADGEKSSSEDDKSANVNEVASGTVKSGEGSNISAGNTGKNVSDVRASSAEKLEQYYIEELLSLPDKMKKVLEDKERIQWFASKYANAHDIFFIGRGIDYSICLEGSLKMKEISYIHSEAYAAGELKHGTISLVEDGTLVIGVLTQSDLYEKTISNMVECKSRGAYLMGVTAYGKYDVEDQVNFAVYVPKVDEHFIGSLAIIPLQLLGYYTSVAKGLDVDKPRNLAKSVTVE